MAMSTRSDRREYPGCVVEVQLPISCTNYPTIQELAEFLQAGSILNRGGTIKAGRILTSATLVELTTACEAV